MQPFIGTIIQFASNFAPRGWALCDGRLLSVSQNTALFSILGTTYGGDGETTFALPDLRGRAIMHPGTGKGLSPYKLGQKNGAELYTIKIGQLASHTHSASGNLLVNMDMGDKTITPKSFAAMSHGEDDYGLTDDIKLYGAPGSNEFGADDGLSDFSGHTMYAGGGQPVNNQQPFLCVNHIIAIQGIFPPRT